MGNGRTFEQDINSSTEIIGNTYRSPAGELIVAKRIIFEGTWGDGFGGDFYVEDSKRRILVPLKDIWNYTRVNEKSVEETVGGQLFSTSC